MVTAQGRFCLLLIVEEGCVMVDMIDTDAMQAEVDGLTTSINNVLQLKVDLQNWLNQAEEAGRFATLVRPSLAELDEIVSWLSDQKPRMQERLELAYAVAKATVPGFVIGGMPGHGATVPVDMDWIDKTQSLVTAANSGSLTAAQWAQIEQASQDKTYGAWFGVTFYNQVSPDKVADLVAKLSSQYDSDSRKTGLVYSQQGPAAGAAWEDQVNSEYQARLQALGVLLGDASRQPYPALRSGYADDVVKVFQSKNSVLAPAMSVVLSYGSYSTGFATTVADGVYDYERSDQFPGWGGSSSPYVVMPGGSHRTDAMAGVMVMLGNSPDAAQQFFATGGTVTVMADGQSVQVSEKMQYLVTQHSWDTYLGSENMSDGGDGLGKALEAATTSLRTGGSADQATTSAELATQVFVTVGERTNQSDDWEMPTGMRDSMADIMASYMPDLFTAQLSPNAMSNFSTGLFQSDEEDFPGFPPGAKFTQAEMDAILQTVGKDPDDVKILGAGWAVTNQAYVGHQLDVQYSTPGARADALSGINNGYLNDDIQMGAKVLNQVMGDAFGGNANDIAQENARHEMESQILGLAGLLPIPIVSAAPEMDRWAEWASDQGKDVALELAKENLPHVDTAEVNQKELTDYSKDMEKNAVNMAVQIMYSGGFWDAGTLAQANAKNQSLPYTAPPPEAFNPDGSLNVNSDAYGRWIQSRSGLSSSVQSDIGDVYTKG